MHKKGRETIRAPGLFIFPQGDLEKGGWWTKNILKATEPFIFSSARISNSILGPPRKIFIGFQEEGQGRALKVIKKVENCDFRPFHCLWLSRYSFLCLWLYLAYLWVFFIQSGTPHAKKNSLGPKALKFVKVSKNSILPGIG
jgi:hypothetical protein